MFLCRESLELVLTSSASFLCSISPRYRLNRARRNRRWCPPAGSQLRQNLCPTSCRRRLLRPARKRPLARSVVPQSVWTVQGGENAIWHAENQQAASCAIRSVLCKQILAENCDLLGDCEEPVREGFEPSVAFWATAL